MYAIEVLHEQDLTVTLATIARLRSLGGLPDLDDNNVPVNADELAGTTRSEVYSRNYMSLEFV